MAPRVRCHLSLRDTPTVLAVQETIQRVAGMMAAHVDDLHARRIDPPAAWLRLDSSLLTESPR